MTMKRKTLYEAPSSELLLVKFEEAFLQGTGGAGGPDPIDDDDEEDY